MSEPFWYKDIKVLFNKHKLIEFWPSKFQTFEEKINSLTRFILYSGLIISSYKHDTTPFIISLMLVVVLAFMTNNSKKLRQTIQENIMKSGEDCFEPTKNNPLGNQLPFDSLSRLKACDSENVKGQISSTLFNEFPTKNLSTFNINMQERQFFSMPNTDIVNDQKGFASWLYGDPNRKMCKSNPEVCTGGEGNINGALSGGPGNI